MYIIICSFINHYTVTYQLFSGLQTLHHYAGAISSSFFNVFAWCFQGGSGVLFPACVAGGIESREGKRSPRCYRCHAHFRRTYEFFPENELGTEADIYFPCPFGDISGRRGFRAVLVPNFGREFWGITAG